jgi:hypothetical protein
MAHKLRKDKVVVRSATVPDIGGMTSLLQELFNAEPDFAPNVRLQLYYSFALNSDPTCVG